LIAVFLFYDKTHGIFERISFSKDYKHCNILTFDGIGFVLSSLDKTGVTSKSMKINNLTSFLRRVPGLMPSLSAIIVTYVQERKPKRWMPLSLNTCNEVARDISGLDIPFSFNVENLYKKIILWDQKSNYIIDYKWSRKDGRK